MISWVLAGLTFLGVILDVGISVKRIKALGLQAELNGLVKWACEKLGIWKGMAVSILAPWAVVLGASGAFHWDTWLGFLFGMRLLWAIFQLDALKNHKV